MNTRCGNAPGMQGCQRKQGCPRDAGLLHSQSKHPGSKLGHIHSLDIHSLDILEGGCRIALLYGTAEQGQLEEGLEHLLPSVSTSRRGLGDSF